MMAQMRLLMASMMAREKRKMEANNTSYPAHFRMPLDQRRRLENKKKKLYQHLL